MLNHQGTTGSCPDATDPRPIPLARGAKGPSHASRLDQVEEALREANQVRQALEAQLLQAMKLETLGNLAGGLAHDLNNVMGAILALAAGSRMEMDPGHSHAATLDSIISACERGQEVVGELLRFVRKEPGAPTPVSLNRVVDEMVRWLSPEVLKGSILTLDLDSAIPEVLGKAGALSHALMNLCVNAVDAMPDGGTLTLRTRVGPGGEVLLTVRDTGVGMPEAVARRAEEAFYTTKAAGTGLGLPLVAATMKAHGGTLELATRPGEGTEVRLVFPAVVRPVPVQAGPRRALRILMVDDDPHLRDAVCPVLESLGHRVDQARGGLEAIRMFEQGLDVDMVLLDQNMPGLSGLETLPRILGLRPGQAVLLATGSEGSGLDRFLAQHLSAARIAKPFNLEQLLARMAELQARAGRN